MNKGYSVDDFEVNHYIKKCSFVLGLSVDFDHIS